MSEPVPVPSLIPPKRRPWRFWRWVKRVTLAFLLLIVAVLLVGFGEMKWTRRSGQKKLEAMSAKLDADDPGWRFEDIIAAHNAKVPPDESNSAMRAVTIVKRFPKFESGRSIWQRKSDLDVGQLPNELPDAEKWKELDIDYSAHEPGLIELRQWDAATPRGRFKIEYSGGYPFNIRFDNCQEVRNALTYLTWDSLHFAYAGKGDRALASTMAGLHLVRSVDFEPIAIEYLVRIGAANQALKAVEQTLAWCPTTSDKQLATMQELVRKESVELSIRPFLRGERAFILKGFDLAAGGEVDLDQVLELRHQSTSERLGFWYLSQFLPANSAHVIERFDDLLLKLDLPPGEKLNALKVRERSGMDREKLFARLVLIPMSVVAIYELQHQARCLCAAAGIACERYRLKHNKWPSQLSDLSELIVSKDLIDPFDGKPLRFKILNDGAVVYSVGKNGVDDEGDVFNSFGDPKDVGFRLWNVDRRKVPPKPEPALEDFPTP